MTMATFPTSPWSVQDQGTRLLIDAEDGAVAHIPYVDQSARRAAALIASAPQLVRALQLSLQLMDAMRHELDTLVPPDEKSFDAIRQEHRALTRWAHHIINQAEGDRSK